MGIYIIAGPEDAKSFGEVIGCFFDKREVHVLANYGGMWSLRHDNKYMAGMSQEEAEKEANIRPDLEAALIFVPPRQKTSRIISLDEL